LALHSFVNVPVAAVLALLIPQSLGAEVARVNVRAELADFQIRVEPPAIKAGQITFEVRNISKSNVHEMIVVATNLAPTPLPYQAKSDRVDEGKLRSLGEVSALRPGALRRLTLRLKPGKYLLLCNEAGHYKAGMVTVFTVTR
jgi:uncharacterized cupredoxin-like copper-binding protein